LKASQQETLPALRAVLAKIHGPAPPLMTVNLLMLIQRTGMPLLDFHERISEIGDQELVFLNLQSR
jgi:hypothetical protein